MKTKITICIPVYNREKTIEQTLKSVINAKLTNYEILISDNSSTDKTKEICLKIQKKYPHLIKYFENKKNLGFAENYKNCINKAEGEYLFFIGGDDILLPNGINNLILTLDRSPQADIVCSDIYTFSNNPSIIEKKFIFFNGKKRVFQKGSNVLINWLFNSAIGSIGGYLIRSSEAKKYIKFIPSDSLVPQVHLSAYMAIHNNIIHYPIFTFAQRLTESPTQLANKQYLSLHIVKEIFKLINNISLVNKKNNKQNRNEVRENMIKSYTSCLTNNLISYKVFSTFLTVFNLIKLMINVDKSIIIKPRFLIFASISLITPQFLLKKMLFIYRRRTS